MDDEGYEGSGEEVIVRRGRSGVRRRAVKSECASTEPEPATTGEKEVTESEGDKMCNGDSEEAMETSPLPADHVKEGEVSMETDKLVTKPSPNGVAVENDEGKTRRESEPGSSEEGDVKSDDVKSGDVTIEPAMAGNSNNNSNKRSGEEEGGSAGEGEEKTDNRRRSLRSQKRSRATRENCKVSIYHELGLALYHRKSQ